MWYYFKNLVNLGCRKENFDKKNILNNVLKFFIYYFEILYKDMVFKDIYFFLIKWVKIFISFE